MTEVTNLVIVLSGCDISSCDACTQGCSDQKKFNILDIVLTHMLDGKLYSSVCGGQTYLDYRNHRGHCDITHRLTKH